jgi:outer membrane protein assembly factor BamA
MADEKKNALFEAADRVHRVTRERVIERSLLFSVGDAYEPDLIRETERSLRSLPFLRKVEVSAVDASSGAVVLVRTWDSWTLEFNGRFSRAGGVTSMAGGVSDRNILGTGRSLGFQYSQSGRSVDRSAELISPQLFGKPFLSASVKGRESAEARHYELGVGRPFYSTLARRALTGGGVYSEDKHAVYDGYSYAGRVQRRHYEANVTVGRALTASTRRTRRVYASLVQIQDDYTGLREEGALYIPGREQRTQLELSYEGQDISFIKQKRIQRLSRAEDFNMGLRVAPSLAYAPRWSALGSTGERLAPRLDARKGWVSELGHFLFLNGGYSSAFVNGGSGWHLASAEAVYLCRVFPRHTAASRLRLDRGWRLPANQQMALGEDTGLRGYRAAQFSGDRRLLFNLEDRIFFVENLLRLLDAGGVLFFDSGRAWLPGEAVSLREMKSSVGFGLRLAAARSASNVPVRIDLARALHDNQSRSRWTLSIQASQAFGPN